VEKQKKKGGDKSEKPEGEKTTERGRGGGGQGDEKASKSGPTPPTPKVTKKGSPQQRPKWEVSEKLEVQRKRKKSTRRSLRNEEGAPTFGGPTCSDRKKKNQDQGRKRWDRHNGSLGRAQGVGTEKKNCVRDVEGRMDPD